MTDRSDEPLKYDVVWGVLIRPELAVRIIDRDPWWYGPRRWFIRLLRWLGDVL